MCGIVGLHLKNPGLQPRLGELLTQMLEAMTTRGPDSAGIAVYAPGALLALLALLEHACLATMTRGPTAAGTAESAGRVVGRAGRAQVESRKQTPLCPLRSIVTIVWGLLASWWVEEPSATVR